MHQRRLRGWRLDPRRWGCEINSQGHLVLDDCDLVAIARDYGTPTHVVSRKRLVENCDQAKAVLRNSGEAEVYYSYKTNCVPGILKLIHEQGIGAEVISPYELWLALKLGVPGERIIFNGPHKTRQSIKMAVECRVKLINVDSLTDIRNLIDVCKETGTTANVGVRLCPSSGWSAQFGLDMKNGEAKEGLDLLSRNKDMLNLRGIHMHLGSQVSDARLYARVIKEVMTFLHEFDAGLIKHTQYLDVGGGFAVPTVREVGGLERAVCRLMGRPFAPPDPDNCPTIEGSIGAITSAIRDLSDVFGSHQPALVIEPGRVITSNAQALLLGVRAIKRRKTPTAILDGGKMNIAYPTSFEYHEILVANKMRTTPESVYNLVGRTCTPSDTLYSHKKLPSLENGDVIAVMDAGAYFSSFSSSFAFPKPSIVLADAGRTTILRKGETFEGMVSRDVFA